MVLLMGLLPLAKASLLPGTALHDTYYVVAHYHRTMPWAGACGVFAVVYFFLDRGPSSPYPRPLAWAHIGSTYLGLMFVSAPMFMPMPQGYVDYPGNFALWNAMGATGYVLIGLGLCAFLAILGAVVWRRLRRA